MAEVVHRAPRLFGLNRTRWWLAGIAQVVDWLSDKSLTTVHQTLRRLGLSYKRGRDYVHSPDAFYNLKLSYIQAALHLNQDDPMRFVALYQDEMTYYRLPSMARAYVPTGSSAPLAYTGYAPNRKRRICGALDVHTGALIAQQRSRFPVSALLAFYRHVEATYPTAERIFVIQDNWPVHFHPHISLSLQSSRIMCLRLPTYAPWTNPIEQVWRRLRQELLHLHPFGDDWIALQQAVQAWLDQWSQGSLDLLHYVGLTPV